MNHIQQTEQAIIECLVQFSDTAQDILDRLAFDRPFESKPANMVIDICRGMIQNGQSISIPGIINKAPQNERNGLLSYITHCTQGNGNPSNIKGHLSDAVKFAKARHLSSALNVGLLELASEETPEAVIHSLGGALKAVECLGSTQSVRHVSEQIGGAVELLEKVAKGDVSAIGYSTGWTMLDAFYQMRPGEMSVVAARPSIGKTAFSVNMAEAQSKAGINVAYFTAEMSSRNFIMRYLCAKAGLRIGHLQHAKPGQLQDLMANAQKLAKMPLWLEDKGNIRADEIASKLYQLKRSDDIKIAYVDYLQYVKPPKREGNYGSRENEVAAISSCLKNCAKDLDLHICVLAQLNREAENREPQLSHLRESGAIEQDADVIALLHRERDGGAQIDASVRIGKNRNDQTGKVPMLWIPNQVRFEQQTKRIDDDTAQWAADQDSRKPYNDGF